MKNILNLAVPMTLAQLINVPYSVVDCMYIGHMENTGTLAMAVLNTVGEVLAMPVNGLTPNQWNAACFLTFYLTVYRKPGETA